MKREIKFRAWDLEDKEMKLPTLLHLSRKPPYTNDNNAGEVTHINCNGAHHIDIFNDGYVLMQYTGLKDSKGVEIYEGDILRLHEYEGVEAPVVFHNGAFCIKGFNWDVRKCEVIGNIYESKTVTP